MRKQYSALIVCIFFIILMGSCKMTGRAAAYTIDSKETSIVAEGTVVQACQAVKNAPVYCAPLFNISGEGLVMCCNDVKCPQELEELTDRIDAFGLEGYRIGLLLYDLNSGLGFSYHSVDSFYSASTIKGPYVACIAEKVPSCINESRKMIEDTIHISSNDEYEKLWKRYGSGVFQEWVEEAGCKEMDVTADRWTDINARQLALMWVKMYDYFTNGTEDAAWLASIYTNTLNSCIDDTLGEKYTVYSKAGWINTSDYYNVQHDAGIVMKDGNPYVLVVLSNAYARTDLLNGLIEAADNVHTALILNDN